MLEDSETTPEQLGLQPNITAAQHALDWTFTNHYPAECAFSSIFFTHPGLDVDYLREFIESLSGSTGLSPSNLYSAALRVSHLISPGQGIEHRQYFREELTDDVFKLISRFRLDALWIGTKTTGSQTSHMMAAKPLDKQGSHFCLWDTRSTQPVNHKWELLPAQGVLDRIHIYHTAPRKIELVRFNTP